MFKKLRELLEAETITKEVAEAIDAEISLVTKKANDENAKLRVENKELKESVSVEREALKTEYEQKLKEAKENANSDIEKEFKLKLEEVEKRALDFEQKTKDANKKALMVETLSKFDVIDMDVATSFIDKLVVENNDGFAVKVGDETLSFENGVQKILDEKSFLLKPKGNGGSGAGGGDNSGNGNLSVEDMYKI